MTQEYSQALRRFCGHIKFYHRLKQADPETAKASPTPCCHCGKQPNLVLITLHASMLIVKGHLQCG